MNESQRKHYEWIIKRGGGMISTGEGLGVFISSAHLVEQCPPGWVFIDVSNTSPEDLAKWVAHAQLKRDTWPKADAQLPIPKHEKAYKKHKGTICASA